METEKLNNEIIIINHPKTEYNIESSQLSHFLSTSLLSEWTQSEKCNLFASYNTIAAGHIIHELYN